MSDNPSYRVVEDIDPNDVIIEQTFDLTRNCPAVVIDLQTTLRRLDVKQVVRKIRMTRREAIECRLILPH